MFVNSDTITEEAKDVLWETFVLFEGYVFYMVKGKSFYYQIRENELFFNRNKRSITKLTVNMEFEKVIELQKNNMSITDLKNILNFLKFSHSIVKKGINTGFLQNLSKIF